MLTALANRIYTDTANCFRTLFAVVVPTAIVWYVARHAIYWIACLIFGIEQQQAPSESKILYGETFIATVVAYAVATFTAEMSFMSKLLDKIGHNEGVSPTLLTVATPAPILGFFLFVGFVPGLVLMPFYVAYYAALAIARLAGSQGALKSWHATQVAKRNANVIDISTAKAL